MIKRLRALGGTWKAHRNGGLSWFYSGRWAGARWIIEPRSHLTPRSPLDDVTAEVRWHVSREGVEVGICHRREIIGAFMRRLGQPKNVDKARRTAHGGA